MKGLLVVFALVLVGVAAFGFYQGWFQVSSESADHKPKVTIAVDQDKLQEDKEKVEAKVRDLGHKTKGTTGNLTTQVNKPEPQP